MITSLFQKPVARPGGGSPFKPPAATGPKDDFQPADPALAFKPPVAPALEPTVAPKSLAVTSTSTAALAALGAPNVALYQAIQSLVCDTPRGVQQLQQLLEQGKLSSGTLQNLHSLTQKPRAQGLDGQLLTRETVAILSGPDQNIWQAERFTCGATNLERQWADHPESFTAIVAGLSSPEGKTQLLSGFTLQRAEGSLADDGSGRTHTDRLLQSSIMASAGAGRGQYDVSTDRFSNDQGGGLKVAEIAGITALAQNQPQVVITYDSKSARATQELISQLEPGESFQTAMTNWEGRDHMLLFQGTQDGSARYYDPADHAQHTVPLRDFLWKTQYLVLPQAMASRVHFQPESVHSQAQPK
ncbi:MAG: hypothetical protein KF760_11725 [Candidatus Eremiobacteraeota bacterium]|nr:hypothetical protein [Candidatus Eremiobacteraeota bacterium]MCW5868649.1 hypothetical protein [Candidatus Eremiobacteraeota bacterium]